MTASASKHRTCTGSPVRPLHRPLSPRNGTGRLARAPRSAGLASCTPWEPPKCVGRCPSRDGTRACACWGSAGAGRGSSAPSAILRFDARVAGATVLRYGMVRYGGSWCVVWRRRVWEVSSLASFREVFTPPRWSSVRRDVRSCRVVHDDRRRPVKLFGHDAWSRLGIGLSLARLSVMCDDIDSCSLLARCRPGDHTTCMPLWNGGLRQFAQYP
ncbi:hypothetical protein GY45DRAFT_347007 [Cubamyces sp. BRFM 1775]|nr:hypothetical protein GY45DRAFT_347007 [Cubamyces sp. BRFM 1775]